jgi:hypothetical protein
LVVDAVRLALDRGMAANPAPDQHKG